MHAPQPSTLRRSTRWLPLALVFALTASLTWLAAPRLGMAGAPPGADTVADLPDLTVAGADPASPTQIAGRVGQVVAPNVPATAVGPEPSAIRASSLWWRWTAPDDGRFTFATHGSELDTVLRVFVGAAEVASNDDDGDVATSSVDLDVTEGTTYLIEVEAKRDDTGLVTLGWHPVAEPLAAPGLQAESFSASAGTMALLEGFADIPVSTNTGEKPQSKLWQHDGSWWAVLASTGVSPMGTWVWRLQEDGTWANVLHVSNATNVRGDVKQDGDVVHLLLHGPQTQLVSLEYDAGNGTYGPWSARPNPTTVSLPGSETATIELDSTGRMWLASDAPPLVQVRYSDAPYSTFSAPVTLADDIAADDIAAVVALPGSIGVLWSNQTTQRFGFRTHVDGTPPTSWTPDEVPASQSAQSTGGGMADDHLNLAVAEDGTLYAAVKTSYNRTDRTVIGLLVRRPDGTWDDLYEIDRRGTRPIVMLEGGHSVHVIYTESEQLDDIVLKSSSVYHLDFSDDAVDVLEGDYNNVTGVKANPDGQPVVLASSATHATHAVVDVPAPGPVAIGGIVSTSTGVPVEGVLTGGPGLGGAVVFEVVDEPSVGVVEVTDPATGAYVFTPSEAGRDAFTFRVVEGDVASEPATMEIVVDSAGLRGLWSFEEDSAGDGSGLGNDGSLVGSVSFGEGRIGSGLVLSGGHVSVPSDASLGMSGELTVAAWVRPQSRATQYVVRKGTQGGPGGYELSLAHGGTAFFRVNQGTSGNNFRVDSTSLYPIDGSWVHLAGVYDGTTMRIYVNGVEEGAVDGPVNGIGVNDLAFALGAQSDGTSPLLGGLDEVGLWSRALSPSEVAYLAAAGTLTGEPFAIGGTVTATVGTPVAGTLEGGSPSGDPVVFEIVDEPSLGEVELLDAATGAFVFTASAAGRDSFTFRVVDDEVASAPAEVALVVDAAGLRGLWSFEDESAVDGSGLGNDGSLVGSVSFGDGRAGSGLVLSGGHVSVPSDASLAVSGELTVAAWVRPQSRATQYVLRKGVQGTTDGFELSLAHGGTAFFRLNQVSSGNTFRVDSTSLYPIDGSWLHLAGVYDGTTMRLYVNGIEEGSVDGPDAVAVNALALALGAQSDGTSPLLGGLDEVGIWARALSPSEVSYLAAAGTLTGEPFAIGTTVSATVGVPLAGTLEGGSSSGGPVTFEVVDAPSLGTVEVTDPATGAFVFTPTAAGRDTFTFRVIDGDVASAPAEVALVVDAGGLRGRWSFEGSAADGSGLGNDGSLAGAVSYGTGPNSTGLVLSGGHVSVPSDASLGVSGELTVAAWVRPQSRATQYVLRKGLQGTTDGFELSLAHGGTAFFRLNQVSSGNTFRVDTTSLYPINGTWVHLAGVYDGTTMRIYVNGVEEGSVAGPSAVAVNSLALALGAQSDGTSPLLGGLDEVGIWARALSPTEVADLLSDAPAAELHAVDGAVSASVGTPVTGTLEGGSSSAGPVTFEVVDAPSLGIVEVTDPATGAFVFTPAAAGRDTFTFRVVEGGATSEPATVSVLVDEDGLRGSWSFDEGSAVDGSGLGNDGSLVGAATFGDGRVGSGLVLSGGHVSVTDDQALAITDELTVAAWVRPDVRATQYVARKGVQGGPGGFELSLALGGTAFFRLNQGTSGNTFRVDSTSQYPIDGSWVHLAGVFDGTTMRIYVNGVEEGSVAGPAAGIGANSFALALGAQSDGASASALRGGLDEVGLWARALSPAEVTTLAAAGTPAPEPFAVDGALAASVGVPLAGTLEGGSSSGGPVVFEIVDEPSLGEVELLDVATGAFVFTPTAAGRDTFTFRVIDGDVISAPATIALVVDEDGLRGSWSFDEGSAVDGSGLGNDGSLVGAATFGEGRVGSGLVLSGGHAAVADDVSLGVSGELTVAAWVRPNVRATQYVLRKGVQGGPGGFELSLANGGTAFFRVNQGTSGNTFRVDSSSQYPIDGTWVHLAGVFDGTTMRLYVDGVEEGSVAGPAAGIGLNNLALALGAQSDGASASALRGGLDEVGLWARALSPAEVTTLAAAGTPAPEPFATDGALTASVGTPVAGTLEGGPGGDGPVVFEIVDGPTLGIVEITDPATGAFVFTPTEAGRDTFTFRVVEGTVASESATVSALVDEGGLRGWWSFDGGTAVDGSGLGNHGSLVGPATFGDGRVGTGLVLSGGHVTVADDPSLGASGQLTVAAWVRPNVRATQYILRKGVQGGPGGFELSLALGGTAFFRLNQGTSGNTFRVDSTSQYPIDGSWVHLAGVFDGTTMRIYVNGVEEGSVAGPAAGIGANSFALALGAQSDGASASALRGGLDEVGLWARALSASEVADLVAAGTPAVP